VEKKIKEVIVSERGKVVGDKLGDKLEKEFPGYGIRKRVKEVSKEVGK